MKKEVTKETRSYEVVCDLCGEPDGPEGEPLFTFGDIGSPTFSMSVFSWGSAWNSIMGSMARKPLDVCCNYLRRYD